MTVSNSPKPPLLPAFFTMVRHGQSEANVVQAKVKASSNEKFPAGFDTRHDSFMRLTPLGVEQARATGDWLRAQPQFDRFYVSPHIRTRETAANLQLGGEWRVDDRFRERDWGEIYSHRPMPKKVKLAKKMDEWYWKPPGGESMATGLRLRVESVMNSLYRRGTTNDQVLAVVHGEFISVAGLVIERLTPDAWRAREHDPHYKVQNTMVIQYTCVNPNDADDRRTHYGWRRAICPWDRSLDWDGGEWVKVGAPKQSDEDLMAVVEQYPRLFEN